MQPHARVRTARTRPAPRNAPTATPYRTSSAACADYGFSAGTASFNRRVAGEQQARAAGRASRTYAPALLAADSRTACSAYGLDAGTATYDRCFSREVDARTWRVAEGYRVDSAGRRMTVQSP